MIFSFVILSIVAAVNISPKYSFVETKAATSQLPNAGYVVNDDDYPYQCVCRCAPTAPVGKCVQDTSLKCYCDN